MRGQAPLPKTWSYDEYAEAEKTFCRTVSEADGKVNIPGKFMKENSLRMGHCTVICSKDSKNISSF